MKLEWKKNKVELYIFHAIICMICIVAAIAFMSLSSNRMGEPMFEDYLSFMSLTNILVKITFIILSGTMIASIVIDEFKNNTIGIAFLYPISKKKIIKSKLIIIMIFCFCNIMITTFIINVLVFYFNPILHFFKTPVNLSNILNTVPSVILASITCAGISLIPMFFGMRHKSTATTITSSVIIGFLLNGMVSNGNSSVSLGKMVVVPLILCIVGVLIGYLSYWNIDNKDLG
ncbi:ABC transporter permease [Clostridium estertheticum]|uniref:ABC transporter permease n=2 Tax=Clostridium estertheticum TaxID=238834 RepID=UPI001C0B7F79|nr:ABC transporter permease [Clostridium estertheticum]MBU3173571.1 ABC transporter permease [Clostridium estertheticum]MCB2338795.1 ABC transporter permease [Clostridium estertheticum]